MSWDAFHHEVDDGQFTLRLKVKLAADPTAVDPVVQRIMQVVREREGVSGKEDAIELALAEALVNAVVHGAKSDPTKSVECDVVCDEKHVMLIVVRDPGTGFDPAAIPNPVSRRNIYSNHGRGIFLINQLMDAVKFHKNGTEIHMIKRLGPDKISKARKTSKAGKTRKSSKTGKTGKTGKPRRAAKTRKSRKSR